MCHIPCTCLVAFSLVSSVLGSLPGPKATQRCSATVTGPGEIKSVTFVLLSQDVNQAKPLVLENASLALYTGTWSTAPPAHIYSAVQSATFVNGFEATLDAKAAGYTQLNGTVTYDSPLHHVALAFDCQKGGGQDKCEINADAYSRDNLVGQSTFVGSTLVYTAVFGRNTVHAS